MMIRTSMKETERGMLKTDVEVHKACATVRNAFPREEVNRLRLAKRR